MPPTRAESLEEVAFVHGNLFDAPAWAWPDALEERVPPFERLFVDARPRPAGSPDLVRLVPDLLTRSPGPTKVLITAQRGAGKSWLLRRICAVLAARVDIDVRSALTAPAPPHPGRLLVLDDLDKLDGPALHEAATHLLAQPIRLLATWPFGPGVPVPGGATLLALPNIPVVDPDHRTPPDAALAFFHAVLAALLDPALVDPNALADAVRLSGGLPRAFGTLIQRGCRHALYAGSRRLDARALALAEQERRVELLRAVHCATVRRALVGVRKAKKLDSEHDRRLLDQDLVVEHVDDEPWYDVHPILAPVVDQWALRP